MNAVIFTDEIFLKGANQPWFFRILISNLKKLFIGVKIERIGGGLWLTGLEENDWERLLLIPGVAKAARAARVKSSLPQIKKGVDQVLKSEQSAARAFRVDAARADKKFPFSSAQIVREVGDYVRLKYNWRVDLENYDYAINVHVESGWTYVYAGAASGAGGLPSGSTGRILCLLSGGIDSPVAAYQLMRRGAQVGLIHFHQQTVDAAAAGEKVADLARVLAGYQPGVELILVSFARWQKQIIMNVPADYRMIVTRRLMFKLAEKIAREREYLALATGDSLGQVASQTLENMSVIYDAVAMLKLAPLAGANKRAIMEEARRLGTLTISERPYPDCCSFLTSPHPQTRARLKTVTALEARLERAELELDKNDFKAYHISKN